MGLRLVTGSPTSTLPHSAAHCWIATGAHFNSIPEDLRSHHPTQPVLPFCCFMCPRSPALLEKLIRDRDAQAACHKPWAQFRSAQASQVGTKPFPYCQLLAIVRAAAQGAPSKSLILVSSMPYGYPASHGYQEFIILLLILILLLIFFTHTNIMKPIFPLKRKRILVLIVADESCNL